MDPVPDSCQGSDCERYKGVTSYVLLPSNIKICHYVVLPIVFNEGKTYKIRIYLIAVQIKGVHQKLCELD